MNVAKIFEGCVDIEAFDEECFKLLESLMSITSPMKFDDDFATDEQLDRLEAELDRFNRRSREADTLRQAIQDLAPYQSNRFTFI
jgi:hypothetical protein